MSEMTKKVPAAAYARFSSDHQRDESIDAQLRAINDYADHNGFEIVETYTDRALSARSDQRPGFQRMVQDSRSGAFKVIIVHKLDRFSRDRYDSAFYRHELKKNGVTLCSVVENIDNSPESIILESVIEGMNEYYSKNLARETMKGLKENALTGRHTGGTALFGYKINPDTKRPETDPDEASAVRMIFDMAFKGDSYAKIAHTLNSRGFRTRRGNEFTSTSLHDLLTNQKYIGKCIYNKRVSQSVCNSSRCYKDESEWIVRNDVYEPIVSEEVFDAVQRKLRARKLRENNHYKEVYLLTGKIRCAVCGGYFCGTRKTNGKGKISFSYICNGHKQNGCTNPSVNRSYVESFVLEKLAQYVFSDSMIPVIAEEYNKYLRSRDNSALDRMNELIHEKNSIAQKINTATDMILETKSKTLMNRLMLLEKRQEAIERELSSLAKLQQESMVSESELASTFREIRRLLAEGTLINVKQLVDKYVQRVDIYPEKIVVYFNLFPHLRPQDKPCNNSEEHSGNGCSSSYVFTVPPIMVADTARAAFSTGESGNFVKGMKILNRLRI